MRLVTRRRIQRFLDVQRRVDRTALRSAVLASSLATLGCGGFEPVQTHEAITDPAQLYMELRLDHRAVNLATAAPYSTLQLTATPLDATGAPMAGLPAPTFSSSDTTRVWVTPEGLLQARGGATNVRVIAELVADGNVRHVDTAMVNVTANPTPTALSSLSIDPIPPDSAAWVMGPQGTALGVPLFYAGIWQDIRSLTPSALDSDGMPIPGLAVEYASADETILQVGRYTGRLTALGAGQVQLTARTTAYGVTKEATLTYTVGWPISQQFEIRRETSGATTVTPQEVRLAVGGIAVWRNPTDAAVDVTFDNPAGATAPPPIYCQVLMVFSGIFGLGADCGTGDVLVPIASIDAFNGAVSGTAARQFLTPGTYTYGSTFGGVGGTIIVAPAPSGATTRVAVVEP